MLMGYEDSTKQQIAIISPNTFKSPFQVEHAL